MALSFSPVVLTYVDIHAARYQRRFRLPEARPGNHVLAVRPAAESSSRRQLRPRSTGGTPPKGPILITLCNLDQMTDESGQPLFSIRLPTAPHEGHIDSHGTVIFEKTLITDLSGDGRILRFALRMPGIEFVDFGEFQAIYQEKRNLHGAYLSNPLDISGNRQGVLAFVVAEGSLRATDEFEVAIHDVRANRTFRLTSLGEHVFPEPLVSIRAGAKIGPYKLQRRLGSGGNADVFLATDGASEVAIKIIRRTRADRVERFRDEIRALREVGHARGVMPLIADSLDIGGKDPLWIAMPVAVPMRRPHVSKVTSPEGIPFRVVADVA